MSQKTKEELTKKELKKRLKDKEWRMNNLYKIKDKDGKEVLFKYNYAQKRFLQNRHNASIILKARQQGFTTLSCISFLDDCLFKKNISAGIIAHNLEDAADFFENKIKFAYDNLDDDIKQTVTADTNSAGKLKFSNGSSIRVRTSFRSGTLQRLHISEFGKICAKTPDKAKEIVTGALNAIAKDQVIIIESTAEGKVGYFYEYCERARTNERLGQKLTEMDFKFNFFPWYESPEYRLNPEGVAIPQRLEKYFADLEKDHGIKLDDWQKAWYVKKELTQGEDMLKEYPSHPDEAFAQSIEGAYYGQQFAWLETNKRIGTLPYEPMLKVHTAWDLGMDDSTTIWFFQVDSYGARRYIDYYENSGENLEHYVRILQSKPYLYGKVILPHDANVRELQTGKSRVEALESLGFRDIHVVPNMAIMEGINAVRLLLPKCWFDLAKCGDGIEALKQYRKDWNDKAGTWANKPLHDWTSHAADSFRMSALVDVHDIPMPTQRKASNKFR